MASIITNLDLFVILKNANKLSDYNFLFQTVLSCLSNSVSEEDCVTLKEFCRRFTRAAQKRYESTHRKFERFRTEYGSWLETDVDWPSCLKEKIKSITQHGGSSIVPISEPLSSSNVLQSSSSATGSLLEPSTSSTGTMTKRKITNRKPFEDLRTKQKKRRSGDLKDNDSSELVFATISKLKDEGQNNIASVIEFMVKHPESIEKLQDIVKTSTSQQTFSPQKALGLLISLKFSKWQYITLRESAIREGLTHLYPSYYSVQKEKNVCFPPEPKKSITVTDSSVNISLQALLDLTAKRIIQSLPERIQNKELILISKYGFDGASSQSRYKQKMDSTHDDSSIFMTSLSPLKLTCEDITVWENPKPCSAAYCRPVRFTFVKESETVVKEEHERVKAQISALQPSDFDSNMVSHKLMLTMVDAKIKTYLSPNVRSNAACYICMAKPSEMNNLEEVKKKSADDDLMELGLSSLHARINIMECLLHIAYKLDIKKWSARGESEKAAVDARKKTIQARFKTELNLLIDVVKQGYGTTNDGNTARRFFEFPEKTAAITGLDEELIRRFAVILQAITSGETINNTKFKDYTEKTAEKYVKLYNWYYMSSTVHTVLLHGAEIIASNSIVPIGNLSEEASEARNKDFRRFREHHSRKKSRVCSNEDIFNFLLLSSDPLISAVRPTMDAKKKKPLFDETLDLLNLQRPEFEFRDITQIDSDSELDSDSDSD